jgi:hypothetical protein
MQALIGPEEFARTPHAAPEAMVDGDLVKRVVLNRVGGGTVDRRNGRYYDYGRPFPRRFLPDLYFDVLHALEFIAMTRYDGCDLLSLTPAGRRHLDELNNGVACALRADPS